MSAGPSTDKTGRVLRMLTFWLRPAFALRVVRRFERIAGFDRAVALASSGLTALVPLTIVTGAVFTHAGGAGVANRIIRRYDLSAEGADAVRAVFAPTGGTSDSVGLVGAFLLLLTALSFARAVQRLFEQTWELPPLSIRNTVRGIEWIVMLLVYMAVSTALRAAVGRGRLELAAALLTAPLTAGFLWMSGWTLSGGRVTGRRLLPFTLIGTAATTAYAIGATVYVPHMFSSYATRYGVVGAVLALISALFGVMTILVASSAAGREVADELDRIRAGERPARDEVRREWDALVTDLRNRIRRR